MSSSPEPHPHSSGTERTKRRERPPALDFKAPHKEEARSDREDAPQVNTARVSIDPPPTTHLTTHHQPLLHVSTAEPEEDDDDDGTELALPRSASATSSLDPYYFGVGTPSESPVLQSSPMSQQLSLKTPELGPFNDPVTPRKDPAAIDRRGLVGVGELATPRWARGERKDEIEVDDQLDEEDDDDEEVYLDDSQLGAEVEGGDLEKEPDLPDSPWTIEAIDGEPDDLDEVSTFWCRFDSQDLTLCDRPVSGRAAATTVTSHEALYRGRKRRRGNLVPSPTATICTRQVGLGSRTRVVSCSAEVALYRSAHTPQRVCNRWSAAQETHLRRVRTGLHLWRHDFKACICCTC